MNKYYPSIIIESSNEDLETIANIFEASNRFNYGFKNYKGYANNFSIPFDVANTCFNKPTGIPDDYFDLHLEYYIRNFDSYGPTITIKYGKHFKDRNKAEDYLREWKNYYVILINRLEKVINLPNECLEAFKRFKITYNIKEVISQENNYIINI